MAIKPEGEGAARLRAVEERLADIDVLLREEGHPEAEELAEEYDELGAERDALATSWSPEDRARAGVLAYWDGDGIATVAGLVRPGDLENRTAAVSGTAGTAVTPGGGAGGVGTDCAGDDAAPWDLVLSASLEGDLRAERAAVIGAGLAAGPALAHDLLLFKVASDLMAGIGSTSHALNVTAQRALRPHCKPDGMDPRRGAGAAARGAGPRLVGRHRTVPDQFEAFRRLEPEMKTRITVAAMADAVEPCDLDRREPLLAHAAPQAVPDLRADWRPTGEAFFSRLTKGPLLGLLAHDLCQPEEAAHLAGERKGAVVEHLERLFAEPFATLTFEQREAVETWVPPGMAIAPAGPDDEGGDDPFGPDDAPFGDPEEDEASDATAAFGVDPDETFDMNDEPVPEDAPETAGA